MALCTNDIGFASAKTYDLEVWLPAPRRLPRDQLLLECEVLPGAQDAGASFHNAQGKPSKCTLNGSGLAVGRALVAVMENYQRRDSGIDVPKALVPYMGGVETIEPKPKA